MEGELQLNLTSSSTLTTDNNKRKQSEINEDDPEYTSGHEKKRPKRAHQNEGRLFLFHLVVNIMKK